MRSLRTLAFTLVPRVCGDVEVLEALKIAYALRRDRLLLRALFSGGCRAVVDRYPDIPRETGGSVPGCGGSNPASPIQVDDTSRRSFHAIRTCWGRVTSHTTPWYSSIPWSSVTTVASMLQAAHR